MANSFLNQFKRQPGAQDVPVDANVPADAGESMLADDGRGATRIGLWALAIGFGGFLLWAAFAPLDEGVSAPGQISIDTKRKAVQHLSGGLVKEVLVREGQQVKDGQVLIKLDDANTRASFEGSRQRYLSLRAMEARLRADQAGSPKIVYHPDLLANSSDPLIKAQMVTQEQLLAARRGALNADLQSLNEQIQGTEASIQAYTSMVESRKSQLALLNEELKNTRGLVADGYAPRNRQFELERMAAESSTSLADLQGNILRSRRSIGDLRSRAISRQQDHRKEVETQLADVSREVLAEAEKFRALQNEMARVDIKAPATGQVVGLAVQTTGGVIQPGQKLMDIVPQDEPLLLEARVAPNFIDQVQPNMPVDIRFSSFAHSPSLVVDGKVLSVSGDLITDPATNQSYYLARVAVTPEGLKKLGNRQMQAGMPTEMIFRTGERSLLTYLLGPLYKRMASSMKEA